MPPRSHPLLHQILLWIALPVALGAAAGFAALGLTAPRAEGPIGIAGLIRPVIVVRDEHGLPHVYAGSERDAFLALGYLHAGDRLWLVNLMALNRGGPDYGYPVHDGTTSGYDLPRSSWPASSIRGFGPHPGLCGCDDRTAGRGPLLQPALLR